MRRFLPVILVFAAITAMLIVIEARPQFPDPDSFYHAKMALIIRDHGFIQQFPWLQETVLANNYVDHHLLYHLLLIPFVTLFPPLVGMKVSAVVFGLLAFYVLYRFLKALEAPWPEWLTMTAALSANFFHRMSLPRAPSLSLVFLLLGVWAMHRRKPWLTAFFAFGFVWLYNGWPLLIVAYAVMVLADVVAGTLTHDRQSFLKTGFGLLAGLIAGLVINPYFPTNIQFDLLHIIKIGAINYAPQVAVGQEWGPMDPLDFIAQNVLSVVALALATVLFLPAAASRPVALKQEKTRAVFAFLFLFAGFFVMTLRSNRYTEYAVPFAILTVGALGNFLWPFLRFELGPMLAHWFSVKRWRLLIAALPLMSLFVFAVKNVQGAIGNDYFRAAQYQGAADWLKANVPQGTTVFHNAWDSSMVFFYLDDQHYFLVGLDPRFMYDKNPERYQTWFDFTSGIDARVEKIPEIFGTKVIVIDERIKNAFQDSLVSSSFYTETYRDDYVRIFVYENVDGDSNL